MKFNSQSRRLGETPTSITYPPEWPFGRYTHPAGGRFIRPYGQTSPLPEALTELRKAEVESPPARIYLDSQYVEKSPELSPHEWGATTRVMTEEERAYLAAWGRPRLIPVGRPSVARVSAPLRLSWFEEHKKKLAILGLACIVGAVVVVARR